MIISCIMKFVVFWRESMINLNRLDEIDIELKNAYPNST
jgi:hypothetical protein